MVATQVPSSPAQIDFIRGLLRERDTDLLDAGQILWLESKDFSTLSKDGASRVITALKELPRRTTQDKARAQSGPHNVPNGRYAIERDGTLKFYKVNSPTEGKWVGWTFVDVQASDELYAIRNRTERDSILAQIAEDYKAAMLRYGQEIGSCGHCGRTLTNELSRELGIGPICRGKMGW